MSEGRKRRHSAGAVTGEHCSRYVCMTPPAGSDSPRGGTRIRNSDSSSPFSRLSGLDDASFLEPRSPQWTRPDAVRLESGGGAASGAAADSDVPRQQPSVWSPAPPCHVDRTDTSTPEPLCRIDPASGRRRDQRRVLRPPPTPERPLWYLTHSERRELAATKVLMARHNERSGGGGGDDGFDDVLPYGDYETVGVLGEGSFSVVFRVRMLRSACGLERGGVYALKRVIRPVTSFAERTRLLEEFAVGLRLGPHANILGYYAAWQEGGRVHFLLEDCANGSLEDVLGACAAAPLPDAAIVAIATDIARVG
jgi:hypothetical protein